MAGSACNPFNPVCAVGSAVSSVAGDALSAVAQAVTDAVGTVVKTLGTVWTSIATPDLTGDGVSGWVQGALLVLSILVGGARMFWERRAAPGRELLRSLLTFVVVNGAGLAAIALLAAAGDSFASWIVARSTASTDFATNLTGLLAVASLSGLGLILAWIVALLMYKPAAAIVYAVAFRLTGAHVFGTDGLTQVITGLCLMILALFALPALVRFVTPMVTALSTTGGGGAGVAAGTGVAVLATGAQLVSLRGSGPSAPPAAPPLGPSGACPTGGGGGGLGLPFRGPGPGGPSGASGSAPRAGTASGATGGGAAAGGRAGGAAGAAVQAVQAGQAAAGMARGLGNQATGGLTGAGGGGQDTADGSCT